MNLKEEYKELYYKELEICDRLNSKIGTSLTLLTIIGTGHIILWKDISVVDWSLWSHRLYCLLIFLALISYVIAITYFIKSYSGYKYEYIPIDGCNHYIESAKEYAKKNNISETSLNEYIENMFIRKYIQNTIINRKLNLRKTKLQYRLTRYICITFALLFVAYAIWIVTINPVKESENKYIIINREVCSMLSDEKKIPDDFQPDPPSDIFHETFSISEDIRHSDTEKSDSTTTKKD